MSGMAQEQAEALAAELGRRYPGWAFTPIQASTAADGWVVQSRHRAVSGKSMKVTSLEEFQQHLGRNTPS